MKVCVLGYGALGHAIVEQLGDELACIVSLESEYKKIEDTNGEFDCIIDCSSPACLEMIYNYAVKYNKPVVFATTGYSEEQLLKIRELSRYVPVLKSANFSLGVTLLNRIVKLITPILKDDFDIEIIEAHHHNKVDAPSGTAKMLLNSVKDSTGFNEINGRVGNSLRKPNEIGVHSIRGGSIVGEHEVMYCGLDEVISVKHSAYSKKIFAVGGIKAARFLIGQEVGYYTMDDVLFND